MLNNVSYIGKIVENPELKYQSNKMPFVPFNLLVKRNYKNKNNENDIDYPEVRVFGSEKYCKSLSDNLYKGRLVAVSGEIRTFIKNRDIKNNNKIITTIKEKVTYLEVKAGNVHFLSWPDDSSEDDKIDVIKFD